MARLDTARVIQSLAAATVDEYNYTTGGVDPDSWPKIASLLPALGCDWPAATDLAAMVGTSQPEPAILDALERLVEQTGRELGDLPALCFWDTVCGLIGRGRRLGLFDEIDAIYRLAGLWWDVRDLPRPYSQGMQIIGEGLGLTYMLAEQDVRGEATALLAEADQLIPADAVTGPLCEAVLDAVY
ncbi:hypothetical protein [Nocardia brevicatena]|uniref:hypothetical protein n=1 Tax=Nocardia brevicatena TaxID=37327 RepID=UPI000316E852|nr:hypothetical protein [Nocardia brevicatena]